MSGAEAVQETNANPPLRHLVLDVVNPGHIRGCYRNTRNARVCRLRNAVTRRRNDGRIRHVSARSSERAALNPWRKLFVRIIRPNVIVQVVVLATKRLTVSTLAISDIIVQAVSAPDIQSIELVTILHNPVAPEFCNVTGVNPT